MTFLHPVLHDGETMVFWQAFDLALVLATVAVGAWKVLGFGQQKFDAGRDLFFSAVRPLFHSGWLRSLVS